MMTSQTGSNQLLKFCYDCGCLQLRDVTNQLQELLTSPINPDLCGICKKYVQTINNGRTHEATVHQDEAEQDVESNVPPVVSKVVKCKDQSLTLKLECDSHSLTVCPEIVDNDNDDVIGDGYDEYNDDDDDDCNNISTGDGNTESSHNVVESLPGKTLAQCTLNDTSSINLTDVSTRKSSRVASKKRLGRKKVAVSKAKSKQSSGSKTNKGKLDAGTTLHQKKRVTRLSSGVIKAANYQSLFGGDQKSGENDSEEEEKDGEEEKNKKEEEEEEEYHASDDDFDPHDSDVGDNDDDIDISQYIVKKSESEVSTGSRDNKARVYGIESLVPAMQELVVLGEEPSKQFKCKLCGEGFRGINQFHLHAATSHTAEAGKIDDPFVCVECDKKCKRFKFLVAHRYRHAKEFVTYKCTRKNCNFIFNRKDLLISHIEVHQGRRQFRCKTCGVGFKHEHSLSVHMSLHLSKERFSCQYCSKKFSHQIYLRNHEWRHKQSGRHKCDLCSYTTEKKSILKRHIAQVHLKTHVSLECKRCKSTFKYKNTFDAHVATDNCKEVDLTSNHVVADLNEVTKNLNRKVVDLMAPVTNIDTPFRCKHCPMVQFKSVISLLKHLKKYHVEHHPDIDSVMKEPYKCSECDKLFNTRPHLKTHHTTHVTACPYACKHPGCNKSFKSKGRLRNHFAIHKERQFMCSQCGGLFISNAKLAVHQKAVHLKLKPHTCSYCGKAFSRKSKLNMHVKRLHLKLKPYVCEKCGRSFAATGDLKSHMRYHTGEKPYKCDRCDYQCIRVDYLTKHKRTHTGERPYHCEVCDTSFAHRTQFVAHQRKNHGINVSSASNASSDQAANSIPVPSSDIPSGSNISVNVKNELESTTAVQFLHENFNF